MHKNLTPINQNITLFLLSLLLFLSQQISEIFILRHFDQTHTELCRWDCAWYHNIITDGYQQLSYLNLQETNLAFFPLFPIFTKIIASLLNSSITISLIISSKILFLFSIFAFIKFVALYFPKIPPIIAGITIAYNPYVIYSNSGYTEPLFLLLTCSCFYFLEKQRLKPLAFTGVFLTATRLVGLSIGVSYGVVMLKKFINGDNKTKLFIVLTGIIMSFGLLSFMIFLHFHAGDAFAFIHASKAWHREISNPLTNLFDGLGNYYLSKKFFAVTTLFAFYCCFFLARKKLYHLALFSFFCTIIPLSTSLLFSMPRYIWYQAPVLLTVCYLINKRPLLLIPLLPSFMIFNYELWFSGTNIIV